MELEAEVEQLRERAKEDAGTIRKLKAEVKALRSEHADLLHEIHTMLDQQPPVVMKKLEKKTDLRDLTLSLLEDENKHLRSHIFNLQVLLSRQKVKTKDKATQTLLAAVAEDEEDDTRIPETADARRQKAPGSRADTVAALVAQAARPTVCEQPMVVHRGSQTDESLLPP